MNEKKRLRKVLNCAEWALVAYKDFHDEISYDETVKFTYAAHKELDHLEELLKKIISLLRKDNKSIYDTD